jgi:hypothetical protein
MSDYNTLLKTGDSTFAKIRSPVANFGQRYFSPSPSIQSKFPRYFDQHEAPSEQKKIGRRRTFDTHGTRNKTMGNQFAQDMDRDLESRVEELEHALSTLSCLSSLSCLASLGNNHQQTSQTNHVSFQSRETVTRRTTENYWPSTAWAQSRPLDLRSTHKPTYLTDPDPIVGTPSNPASESDLKAVDPETLHKSIAHEPFPRHQPQISPPKTRYPLLLNIDLMAEEQRRYALASNQV